MSRFTFWKFERLEKLKSRASEDFLELALSDDTADTPVVILYVQEVVTHFI